MNRIAVILPICSMTDSLISQRRSVLERCLENGTEFVFYRPENQIPSIESRCDAERAASEVLRLCQIAEDENCDGAIIWCADDPGLPAARELVRIPVAGPGESAMLYAYTLSKRYSVVVPQKNQQEIAREVSQRSGLESRLISVRPAGISVLEMRQDPDILFNRLYDAGSRAVEEDGAQAVALGCLGMAGFGRKLQSVLGVPVIDPAEAAAAYLESLIRMGVSFSKMTYPSPR